MAARGGVAVVLGSTGFVSADCVEGGVGTGLGASAPAVEGSLALIAFAGVLGGVMIGLTEEPTPSGSSPRARMKSHVAPPTTTSPRRSAAMNVADLVPRGTPRGTVVRSEPRAGLERGSRTVSVLSPSVVGRSIGMVSAAPLGRCALGGRCASA